MGLVSRNDPKHDPQTKRAIFSAKAGAVTNVVMTKEGANLYYVVSRTSPTQRTLDEARADVEKKWRAEQLATVRAAHVERLKKGGKITVDKAAVAAVEVATKGAGKAGMKGSKVGGAPAGDDDDDEYEADDE